MLLVEGDDNSLTRGLTYAPRKVARFVLWRVTRKTTLGKVGGCVLVCAVGSYEVYRLVKLTNTKVDTFFKDISFSTEKLIMDHAIDLLGQEIRTKYIANLSIRTMLCKIIK